MLPRLELSLFPPTGPLQTCRAVGDRSEASQPLANSCRANGQTNKLAAPLSRQSPSPPLTPPDPPGHWVVALTVSSLKVWEVVSLLSFTSFRVFDSRLAIQASLPLICKYQHAAAEPWFVFPSLYFSFCLCLQALGATSVYTEKR